MVSKKLRSQIFEKYGGMCCYTGTPLEPDWQIDHFHPIIRNINAKGCLFPEDDSINNMVPCQKIINHYKHSLPLETFRTYYLGNLHKRIAKLPRNPRTEKGMRRKAYLLKVAGFFGITADKPFNGKFYFETLEDKHDPESDT